MTDRDSGLIKTEFVNPLRQNMEKVAELSTALVRSNTDKFIVKMSSNDYQSTLTVTANFDAKFDDGAIPLKLSVSTTKYRTGEITEQVRISPQNGSWMDEDALSYRLDISKGGQTEALRNNLISEDNVQGKYKDILLSFYGKNHKGESVYYADNYAESTITANGALTILEVAESFSQPTEMGIVFGMPLDLFMEKMGVRPEDNMGNIAGELVDKI